MATKEGLVQLVLENCQEEGGKKRMSCEAAFELAKQHQIEIAAIGKVCDELKIKIVKCQLGCFGG
ncbi:MAG: hypothetical protein JXA30_17530 [Deltaproteobacteria bacterium]|nr:hypothetical protein [Deltaproteobacteria bacterium]